MLLIKLLKKKRCIKFWMKDLKEALPEEFKKKKDDFEKNECKRLV